MDWGEKMIRFQGDIYCYFGMIQKTVPQSVCDYGLFLCRCGAVARGLGGYKISKEIQFTGVDLYPETTPKIYQKIYDQLVSKENAGKRCYDLGILLRLSECVPEVDELLIENAMNSCRWLATDEESYHCFETFSSGELIGTSELEGERYNIIKGRYH